MTEDKRHPPLNTDDAATRASRARERTLAHDPHALTHESSSTATAYSDNAYQNYLFGKAGTLEKPAWSDSAKGRLAIRMFSRGILGAALFTIGGRMSRTQLVDYDPHTFKWSDTKSRPLQGIAKLFDEAFGKPIGAMARWRVNTKGMTQAEAQLAKANAEWDATMFRSTSYYHSNGCKLDHNGRPMNGRSLGAEMVSVSFDFAMMSVGDAAGRNFVQMIDPHIRKTWMLNDKGEKAKEGEKAHFSADKFIQSWGRSAWRIFSKNQGEDWAVALPYVYQMRWQRKMLSKAFSNDQKGIKVVFDHAWNGGAHKINNEGKIIGDYQLAGAIDLHGRFVGYNVLTLMFREGYDGLAHKLNRWKQDGYSLNLHIPKHIDLIGDLNHAVRYGVKSFIKANLYMNPAVVPFWLMRVPQSKWRGGYINTGLANGINEIASSEPITNRLLAEAAKQGKSLQELEKSAIHYAPNGNAIFNFSTANKRVTGQTLSNTKTFYFNNTPVNNIYQGVSGPNSWKIYEHYEPGLSTWFSKALNPFGQFSYWLGGKFNQALGALPEGAIKNFIGLEDAAMIAKQRGKAVTMNGTQAGRETFARNFVDASLAYTPYFFAKSELGLRVDDRPTNGSAGKMDNAIYKFIDNVVALNPKKTGASVKEIWKLATHHEKHLVMREGDLNHPEPVLPINQVKAEGRKIESTKSAKPNHKKRDSEKNWADAVSASPHYHDAPPTRH